MENRTHRASGEGVCGDRFIVRVMEKKIVRMRIVCLLMLLCGGGICSARAEETLRIGVEDNYPPFAYYAAGKLTGFDVDVSEMLCRELKRPCAITVMPFSECLPALIAGRVDVVVASLAVTEERTACVDFTDSYYSSQSVFIGRAGVFYTDTGFQALAGKRIAVQHKTVQEQFVLCKYGNSFVMAYPSVFDALQGMARGEADLALADTLTGLFFLKSPAGAGCDFVSEALPDEMLTSSAHIAVRKGSDVLRRQINEILPKLRFSGELDQIGRRYFPFSLY